MTQFIFEILSGPVSVPSTSVMSVLAIDEQQVCYIAFNGMADQLAIEGANADDIKFFKDLVSDQPADIDTLRNRFNSQPAICSQASSDRAIAEFAPVFEALRQLKSLVIVADMPGPPLLSTETAKTLRTRLSELTASTTTN
jgi:hypothetical protein